MNHSFTKWESPNISLLYKSHRYLPRQQLLKMFIHFNGWHFNKLYHYSASMIFWTQCDINNKWSIDQYVVESSLLLWRKCRSYNSIFFFKVWLTQSCWAATEFHYFPDNFCLLILIITFIKKIFFQTIFKQKIT